MKVAAVQMDVKILEKDRNLDAVLAFTESAARAGAKLVVFPECALTGYCFRSLDEAAPAAECVPGPSSERIAAEARSRDCTIVVGMLERQDGRIYNAAVVIGPQGLLGSYRKLHLPELGIDRHATLGDRAFPVFTTPVGKVGVSICFDLSFPECGRVLKLQGAQLYAIPTNWPVGSDSVPYTPQVRATENHMHVIAADRVGEERGFRFAGRSKIVDFSGKVLAEAGETEETIIYADVDLAAADRNRVVRVPGVWEFDRMAARRPELYSPISSRQPEG